MLHVLAFSGSLRSISINTTLLRAATRLAPAGLSIRVYDGLGRLPLFNPDDEHDPPAPVRALWSAVEAADAFLIASPEYAHGVTGAMKNALDWLVGFGPFAYKEVAVLNASMRAHHADAALKETLRTMSAYLVDEACVRIPGLAAGMDADAIVASPASADVLRAAIFALRDAVNARRRSPDTIQPQR
ncbi:MAG: NADPH-dependent FMN reductase [Rhodothermales bacterium]